MLGWLFHALPIGLVLVAVAAFFIWKVRFDWERQAELLRPGYDPDPPHGKPLNLSEPQNDVDASI
jgi:hypothetical protein